MKTRHSDTPSISFCMSLVSLMFVVSISQLKTLIQEGEGINAAVAISFYVFTGKNRTCNKQPAQSEDPASSFR